MADELLDGMLSAGRGGAAAALTHPPVLRAMAEKLIGFDDYLLELGGANPWAYGRSMVLYAHQLVGTWSLVSARASGADVTDEAPYGETPRGVLTYTSGGRVIAMVSYSDRAQLSGDRVAAPVEERAVAFATFFAYAGRFTVDEGSVVHHVDVSSVENWVGSDLVRLVEIEGRRLTLRTPPVSVGGQVRETELVWDRLEPL